MKNVLLPTLLSLVMGASSAFAQGTINLAYDVCRIASTTGKDDFTWPNNPCTDPANAGLAATLVGSFKNTSDVLIFSGTTTVLDIFVGNGSGLPDFWQVQSNQCHAGAIGGASAIGGLGVKSKHVVHAGIESS